MIQRNQINQPKKPRLQLKILPLTKETVLVNIQLARLLIVREALLIMITEEDLKVIQPNLNPIMFYKSQNLVLSVNIKNIVYIKCLINIYKIN